MTEGMALYQGERRSNREPGYVADLYASYLPEN